MAKGIEIAVEISLKKRGRPIKGSHSAPPSPVASQKRPRKETIRSVLIKNPAKKIDMRSILDKHPRVKISGPKYSEAGPSNAPEELPNKHAEHIRHCSSAIIIDLI